MAYRFLGLERVNVPASSVLLRLPKRVFDSCVYSGYFAYSSRLVPEWQEMASQEPVCHTAGCCDPGGWLRNLQPQRRTIVSDGIVAAFQGVAAKASVESQAYNEPQQNSRSPYLRLRVCHHRDHDRQQRDTFMTSLSKIPETAILDAISMTFEDAHQAPYFNGDCSQSRVARAPE